MENKDTIIGKDMFQDVPVHKRAKLLEDLSAKLEERNIKKYFSKEQLEHFKDQISSKMISLSEMEEQLNEVKQTFKDRMAPQKLEVKGLLTNVRLTYEEYKGVTYLIPDYEKGEMNYYDAEGKFIESRRLLPSENQLTISQAPLKTA